MWLSLMAAPMNGSHYDTEIMRAKFRGNYHAPLRSLSPRGVARRQSVVRRLRYVAFASDSLPPPTSAWERQRLSLAVAMTRASHAARTVARPASLAFHRILAPLCARHGRLRDDKDRTSTRSASGLRDIHVV